jgi:hypothetical protein
MWRWSSHSPPTRFQHRFGNLTLLTMKLNPVVSNDACPASGLPQVRGLLARLCGEGAQ